MMRHFSNAKDIWLELENLITSSWTTEKKTIRSLFFWKKNKKEVINNIKYKADTLFNNYKNCFDALKKSVDTQLAKWVIMEKYEKYFLWLDAQIEKQIEWMSEDSFNNKVIKSYATSFLKNLRKMNIIMKQKSSIMQWSIISSMWLKEEMASWMYHFESLIKDMLISMSLENIAKAAANVVDSFRSVLEKYNDKLANSMVDTAEEISYIRSNWIVSIEALNNMWDMINTASQKFKQLAIEQNKNHNDTIKSLKLLSNWAEELKERQENYLLLTNKNV